MTFTVTVKQNPLEISFEVGSIGEAVAIVQDESSHFGQLIRDVAKINADAQSAPADTAQTVNIANISANSQTVLESADSTDASKPRRGRPPKNKNQPDPATASAPPPAPVPSAPAAPPAPPLVGNTPGLVPPAFVQGTPPAPAPAAPAAPATTSADPGPIPDFLDRKKQEAAPAAPPAPPPPAPAPAAPPAMSPLKEKLIALLKERTKGAADGGKAYADWLAQMGIVVPGCTFDEALAVIGFETDAKLQPVAAALGIA